MKLMKLPLHVILTIALISFVSSSSSPEDKSVDASLPLEVNPDYVPYESDADAADDDAMIHPTAPLAIAMMMNTTQNMIAMMNPRTNPILPTMSTILRMTTLTLTTMIPNPF